MSCVAASRAGSCAAPQSTCGHLREHLRAPATGEWKVHPEAVSPGGRRGRGQAWAASEEGRRGAPLSERLWCGAGRRQPETGPDPVCRSGRGPAASLTGTELRPQASRRRPRSRGGEEAVGACSLRFPELIPTESQGLEYTAAEGSYFFIFFSIFSI